MHDEFEMSVMGELNFFLGLKIKQIEAGIIFNQSKYIKEMLKKFGLEQSKPMKTPMSSDTKLMKDEECESVDSTMYRGMIGSLLYLTASRPDIMFSVCLCARFQEAPKTSHLEAVKRIFRYINGTTHLGLWCPKGTDIERVVYADSDHVGDYMDRKSTSSICTFMGCCLTSWFSKKQTALAISTTEAEYEGTLLLGNGDGGNEVVKELVVVVDGVVKIDLKVASNDGVDGRGLVGMGAKMRNDFIDRRAPYQHLSASVVDNNHYGVGGYVKKEKRTLKANQYYQNSNLKMLKGIFLEVKKIFETAVGVLRQEKITIDPKDPAAVDQYAKVMKTVRKKANLFSESQRFRFTIKQRTDEIQDARSYLLALKDIRLKHEIGKRKLQLLLFAISGKVEDDASSEEDNEDVVDEAVVEKLIKVNPPRVSPDGSGSYLSETMYGALGKKRVPKADASPPV
nr:retrovirus-related Pol polyprotein from transposon TNT 1-94 [Tanacetum cinerariifolium]